VGKHASLNDRLAHPRIKYLRLGDIEGVHPAVLKEVKGIAPEPLVGLRDVKEATLLLSRLRFLKEAFFRARKRLPSTLHVVAGHDMR